MGVSVCNLKTGQYLGGINSGKWMVPASSLKVLTTLCALTELGQNFRYHTRIFTDGKIDHHGTLKGNIVIKGCGDPSLGSPRFDGKSSIDIFLSQTVAYIQQAGIKHIEGDIIVDYSVFSDDPVPPTWQWDDLGNYYGSGAWGLNILDNTYFSVFDRNQQIGKPAPYLYMDPYIPGFEITNEVIVDSTGTGDKTNIFSYPFATHGIVKGTIPKGKGIFKIRGSIPNPPFYLSYRLYQEIQKAGIVVKQYQATRESIPEESLTNLGGYYSPNLSELIRETINGSINMYCEAMVKTLGVIERNEGSREAGIHVMEVFMKNIGIRSSEFHLEDGSGLSARNQISTNALASFLCVMDSLHGTELLTDLLAEAGKEGTLASVLKANPIQSFVWGKTGSMKGVYSLTGICKAKSGTWLSFSIIINGSPEKSAVNRMKIEEILEGMYKFF